MTKKRVTMQVAPEFDQVIKEIQKELMQSEGRLVSTREITQRIKKEDIKQKILKKKMDEIVNFDRRFG